MVWYYAGMTGLNTLYKVLLFDLVLLNLFLFVLVGVLDSWPEPTVASADETFAVADETADVLLVGADMADTPIAQNLVFEYVVATLTPTPASPPAVVQALSTASPAETLTAAPAGHTPARTGPGMPTPVRSAASTATPTLSLPLSILPTRTPTPTRTLIAEPTRPPYIFPKPIQMQADQLATPTPRKK